MSVLVPLTEAQHKHALAVVEEALANWDFPEDEGSMPQADLVAVHEALQAPVDADAVAVLVEALDSHAYWQLSDPNYRDSGFVQEPGSDDPEAVDALARVNELHDRLEALLTVPRVTPYGEEIIAVSPESLGIDASKDGWFTEYEARMKEEPS